MSIEETGRRVTVSELSATAACIRVLYDHYKQIYARVYGAEKLRMAEALIDGEPSEVQHDEYFLESEKENT